MEIATRGRGAMLQALGMVYSYNGMYTRFHTPGTPEHPPKVLDAVFSGPQDWPSLFFSFDPAAYFVGISVGD